MKTGSALGVGLWLLALAAGARAQGPDAGLAARFKAAAEAQRAGRLEEAAAAYAEVIRLRPDLAEAYVNFGLVRQEQRQYAEAIVLFEKALGLKPELHAARLFLGIAYYSLGRLDPALAALGDAARALPQDPRVLMWLGVAELAAGKAAEAAGHLDAAAALAPGDLDVLYHRGRAHLKVSQQSYEQMYKLDPKSARVHQVLAQSYEEAGRDVDAIVEYELAVQIAPRM
ncbi:MAG TPA: tetratricopeptide repeat protein, partial [Blastocatellia bacterium]|nr:tetratricopeptide repeat protein [Blastocatellia bacterium]